MIRSREWLNPDEWTRDGRGRSWTFSLPTENLIRSLQKVAAAYGVEFELLECSRVRIDKKSFSVYTPKALDQLSLEGPWQYFIRNSAATPETPSREPLAGVGWPAIFAVNGLVVLHHPDPTRSQDVPLSSIGVIHRVVNVATGERREHKEYDTMFRALKKSLQSGSQG
jgi:hypothetical protein